MRKVMTTMVAIVVIAFGSGQTSAQDFGFAFPSNQGSQWRGRGPAANTMLQAAQPRVRASNMSRTAAGSSQFQDLLQRIERVSGMQTRQAGRRMVYHREVERLEVEEFVNEQNVFNIENVLNQFRQGSADFYRNRNRNRYMQR